MPALWTVKTRHHFPLISSFWEQLHFWHDASSQFMFVCTLCSTDFIGTIIFWHIEKTVPIRVVLLPVNNINSKILSVLEIINKEERLHFLMKYGCMNSPNFRYTQIWYSSKVQLGFKFCWVYILFETDGLKQMGGVQWRTEGEVVSVQDGVYRTAGEEKSKKCI